MIILPYIFVAIIGIIAGFTTFHFKMHALKKQSLLIDFFMTIGRLIIFYFLLAYIIKYLKQTPILISLLFVSFYLITLLFLVLRKKNR